MSTAAPMLPRLLLSAIVGAAFVACTSDPVLSDIIDEQGNETADIDKGEYHRAGQRCAACHQDGSEASDAPFTLAGTVFAQPGRQVGVGDVEIRLTDSDGTKYTTKTNCVGNFFIKASDWAPRFPILVDIAKNGVRRQMRSPIGRAKSCADCHRIDTPLKAPLSQLVHIYLYSGDEPGSPNGDDKCPVDPVRPGTQ